jgi:hypothetical protein
LQGASHEPSRGLFKAPSPLRLCGLFNGSSFGPRACLEARFLLSRSPARPSARARGRPLERTLARGLWTVCSKTPSGYHSKRALARLQRAPPSHGPWETPLNGPATGRQRTRVSYGQSPRCGSRNGPFKSTLQTDPPKARSRVRLGRTFEGRLWPPYGPAQRYRGTCAETFYENVRRGPPQTETTVHTSKRSL